MFLISLLILIFLILIIIYLIISFILYFFYKAPFVPINSNLITQLFQQIKLKEGSIFYDLGAGDGRVLILANKNFYQQATGFEINPLLCLLTKIKAKIFGAKINVINQNLLQADISQADYIFIYLLPEILDQLENKIFTNTKQGCQIIVPRFFFKKHSPHKTITLTNHLAQQTFYLYIKQ